MPGHSTLVEVVIQFHQRHWLARENNCRTDLFAQVRIRQRYRRRGRDGRVRTQVLFEVGCGYRLAAAVNDVFDPSGDLQVAVGAPTDEVAAAVKAVWVKAARIVS